MAANLLMMTASPIGATPQHFLWAAVWPFRVGFKRLLTFCHCYSTLVSGWLKVLWMFPIGPQDHSITSSMPCHIPGPTWCECHFSKWSHCFEHSVTQDMFVSSWENRLKPSGPDHDLTFSLRTVAITSSNLKMRKVMQHFSVQSRLRTLKERANLCRRERWLPWEQQIPQIDIQQAVR